MNSIIKTAFDTLGCNYTASYAECKLAYRDLAQVWHPDKYTSNDRLSKLSDEKMKAINTAYSTLTNYFEKTDKYTDTFEDNGNDNSHKHSKTSKQSSQQDISEEERFAKDYNDNYDHMSGYEKFFGKWIMPTILKIDKKVQQIDKIVNESKAENKNK